MEKQPQKTPCQPRKKGMILACAAALLLTACKQSNTTDSSMDSKPKLGMLKVPLYGQQTSMWCWAASTQMILGYYNIPVQQCHLANIFLGPRDKAQACCDTNLGGPGCPPPKDANCVNAGTIIVDSFGFDNSITTSALGWDEICAQIDSLQSPMGYMVHAPAGDTVAGIHVSGGHVRVIVGYFSVNHHRYLVINDPEPVCQGSVYPITYDEYAHGYSNRIQFGTVYNIHKK